MADVTLLTNGDPSEDNVEVPATNSAAAAAPSTSDAPVGTGKDGKKKISNAVLDFCRLVNISTWQNTKARSLTGYKDDNGEYNAVYRYGIGKAINLYCPPDVTHLKCCGKVFKLSDLKTHVSQKHEAYGQSNRTEPSISPA
ncbi:hypothetical protein DAPPUDRAFT_315832 [Daphnia pulex]|uniref:Uncharacterized protein n=1 Tax=Daphnia pulex TaxID=6669 RepID=E9GAZ0_DAPPU|nr:hypothetical protein DAPPUDRAFT_315832 [Daphnia pulex]|eukprot:EFX83344.1 hypothetical protein DAPPUDRAFT_315832 [Daphnia pulex]